MGQRHQHLVGKEVPYVERESTRGKVRLHDPSGNHPHVLVFCPSLETAECRRYLESFRADQGEYRRLDAEVIVLTPSQGGTMVLALPFPVIERATDLFELFGLVDEHGEPLMGVVAVDRYGLVDSSYTGKTAADLPEEKLLLRRLNAVEAQCPECGVPEEGWAALLEGRA